MTSLLELFCDVDDFVQAFYPEWEARLIAEKEQTTLVDTFIKLGFLLLKRRLIYPRFCTLLQNDWCASILMYARISSERAQLYKNTYKFHRSHSLIFNECTPVNTY